MVERAEHVGQTWDRVMRAFDEHMENTGHYGAQERVLQQLELEFRSPILDVGAGPGHLAGKLNERGHEVRVNDISKDAVLHLLGKFQGNPLVDVSSQDAANMEFTKKFKTIVACNTFYYFSDEERDKVIQNWRNLLEKDGSIILVEEYPFIVSMDNKNRERILNITHPIPPEEIAGRFKKNGFELKQRVETPIDGQHKLYGSVFKMAGI